MIYKRDLGEIGGVPIFWVGFLISLSGSAMIGTLNTMVLQVATLNGLPNALLFALGAVSVEVIFVRILIGSTQRISLNQRLLVPMQIFTILLISALSIINFYKAFAPTSTTPSIFFNQNGISPFFWGMITRLLIPTFIPFWFGWNSVLSLQKVLLPLSRNFNRYVLGLGLGTFLAYTLYAVGGGLVATVLRQHQMVFHLLLGSVFLITAVLCYLRFSSNARGSHR